MNWVGRHRIAVVALICAFWAAIVALAMNLPEAPFLSAVMNGEQSFEDLLRREGRKTPTRDDFVFVAIDQATIEPPPPTPDELASNRAVQLMTERTYPWSRELWALFLDRIFAAGARLAIFDLVFNPPNDGDAAFRAALDRYHDRVVIGANFDAQKDNQFILPNPELIPPPQYADDRVGYVNYWPDPADAEVRRVRFTITDHQLAGLAPHESQEVFASLAARALTKLGRAQVVPRDFAARDIRFSALNAYPARSLYEIFDEKFWQANYANGAFFKNKIVLVGVSAQVFHDTVATPISPSLLGPVLHLQTMAAALAGEFLTPGQTSAGYALVGASALCAWGLIALNRRPLLALFAIVGLSVAYLVTARVLYDTRGYLLLTVPVLAAFLLSGGMSLGLEYILERLEKLRTRRTLERYVSKNIVKEILDNPDSFYSSLRGVRIPVTILFSDIVGFTGMTENADPQALVAQLNEYLSRMTAAVFEFNGTLDKFIGDAVMAVWGNVSSRGVAEDAKAAARSALAMRRELRTLNEKWAVEGKPPFAIGIGLNQGEVLVGNIGSQEKLDPTVIGDSVNLASRLEALTRNYLVDILVGPTAGELIRDEFHLRSVARVQVKGKTVPVEIFTLIGARDDQTLDAEVLRSLANYEEGMLKFRARDFADAQALFTRYLAAYPDDFLANMYRERAHEYVQTPPDAAWNAVEIFKKK